MCHTRAVPSHLCQIRFILVQAYLVPSNDLSLSGNGYRSDFIACWYPLRYGSSWIPWTNNPQVTRVTYVWLCLAPVLGPITRKCVCMAVQSEIDQDSKSDRCEM